MLVGRKAPDFKGTAVIGKEMKEIKLADYKGKYLVLFFYPLDFTFVCPTEIVAFQHKLKEFKSRNTEVVGCSVDSKFTHRAWLDTPRNKGGIEGVEYPLLADLDRSLARAYGVLSGSSEEEAGITYTPAGAAYRGTFLIDKNGIVRAQVVTDEPVGRSVEDTLRMVDALQFFEEHGDVCPADWHKGEKGLKKTQAALGDYLTSK